MSVLALPLKLAAAIPAALSVQVALVALKASDEIPQELKEVLKHPYFVGAFTVGSIQASVGDPHITVYAVLLLAVAYYYIQDLERRKAMEGGSA